MTPKAKAASEAFYATLREKGRRIDQATLELAWERAVAAVRGGKMKSMDGSIDPPPEVSVFGEKDKDV